MAKSRKKVSRSKSSALKKNKTVPMNLSQAEISWLEQVTATRATDKGARAELYIETSNKLSTALMKRLEAFERQSLEQDTNTFRSFVKSDRRIFVKKLKLKKKNGDLPEPLTAQARNAMGGVFSTLSQVCLSGLDIFISDNKPEVVQGILVGLDVAAYRYNDRISNTPNPWKPAVTVKAKDRPVAKSVLTQAVALGKGVNLARHLVNLPPNLLNPQTYADSVQKLFKGSSSVKVTVWEEARLKKENMGLLLGVGQASEHPPCMVHLRYRPKGGSAKKPIAFVGKGITFDSGGLDLKPPQFMRWMKKDMGGSAAVVGLLRWAEQTELKKPLDVYLALAENAVSDSSFCPGDVLTARNGLTVEIHNTDAEGRLALADVLDVAINQAGKDAPEKVIDVATLTGAIKAGLGADVAGLFSNNDKLKDQISKAALTTGDYCWPMPLFRPYWKGMKSTVSDFLNCTDGFGGAVTAALFLEKFTADVPWAHLDIFAWSDGAKGSLREKGGSGQGVLLLSEFLSK